MMEQHFCIGFQQVNTISKLDAYLTPQVNELLDCLQEACFITTLDLTEGYWLIPLKSGSREDGFCHSHQALSVHTDAL